MEPTNGIVKYMRETLGHDWVCNKRGYALPPRNWIKHADKTRLWKICIEHRARLSVDDLPAQRSADITIVSNWTTDIVLPVINITKYYRISLKIDYIDGVSGTQNPQSSKQRLMVPSHVRQEVHVGGADTLT